jgi:thioredoxin 1
MKRVLRFTASWCSPCKMLALQLEDIENKPLIEVIDIDSESEVAIEYGIRGVPTLVMMDENGEIKRNTGMMAKAELEEWLND